ncbi:cation diffusion facilitator family transporter [Phycisphaerales bacterium AB-hyl4]|uniref:Cation diffusion facilitator family transporter n=1 Tax=Natronomicrosphaera hydrolytica TaxID=3242702 RepID=A0ABV4U1G7_9BACT
MQTQRIGGGGRCALGVVVPAPAGYSAAMSDPASNTKQAMRVARIALIAGLAITAIKFGIFFLTNSIAVLSDALESIINVVAAGIMLYSIWYGSRPVDRDHPYGHGKIEFMAVGLEGWLILVAGVLIGFEAVRRLISPAELQQLGLGLWLLGGMAVLNGALAVYVWRAGIRYRNQVLVADGKHLMTDVASTIGVFVGLLLVHYTGHQQLDSVAAILVAAAILFTSWRLLWQSFHGLMDRASPHDTQTITSILDEEIAQGHIAGYHKVRHRLSGGFHWVDMHLHVDGDMTIHQGHDLASRIEQRIQHALGQANATAHLEPIEDQANLTEDDPAATLPRSDRSGDDA